MTVPSTISDTILSVATGSVELFGDIITEVWPWLLGFGALFGLVYYIKGRVGGIGR